MDVFALLEHTAGGWPSTGGCPPSAPCRTAGPKTCRRETRRLLEAGAAGGYIFAPAHDVEGDVPLENMLAFIQTVRAQQR